MSNSIRYLFACLATLVAPGATLLLAQGAEPGPLRPGDRVVLVNPTESDRRLEFLVDSRLRVVLPRIGEIDISSIPSRQLADTVRARYRKLQRADDVYLETQRRVSLLGEVRRPGVFFLADSYSLREAVAEAGGITDNGRPCCLTLLRDGIRREFKEWQGMGASELELRSGDVLIVDREAWLKRNVFSLISGAAVLLSTLVLVTR